MAGPPLPNLQQVLSPLSADFIDKLAEKADVKDEYNALLTELGGANNLGIAQTLGDEVALKFLALILAQIQKDPIAGVPFSLQNYFALIRGNLFDPAFLHNATPFEKALALLANPRDRNIQQQLAGPQLGAAPAGAAPAGAGAAPAAVAAAAPAGAGAAPAVPAAAPAGAAAAAGAGAVVPAAPDPVFEGLTRRAEGILVLALGLRFREVGLREQFPVLGKIKFRDELEKNAKMFEKVMKKYLEGLKDKVSEDEYRKHLNDLLFSPALQYEVVKAYRSRSILSQEKLNFDLGLERLGKKLPIVGKRIKAAGDEKEKANERKEIAAISNFFGFMDRKLQIDKEPRNKLLDLYIRKSQKFTGTDARGINIFKTFKDEVAGKFIHFPQSQLAQGQDPQTQLIREVATHYTYAVFERDLRGVLIRGAPNMLAYYMGHARLDDRSPDLAQGVAIAKQAVAAVEIMEAIYDDKKISRKLGTDDKDRDLLAAAVEFRTALYGEPAEQVGLTPTKRRDEAEKAKARFIEQVTKQRAAPLTALTPDEAEAIAKAIIDPNHPMHDRIKAQHRKVSKDLVSVFKAHLDEILNNDPKYKDAAIDRQIFEKFVKEYLERGIADGKGFDHLAHPELLARRLGDMIENDAVAAAFIDAYQKYVAKGVSGDDKGNFDQAMKAFYAKKNLIQTNEDPLKEQKDGKSEYTDFRGLEFLRQYYEKQIKAVLDRADLYFTLEGLGASCFVFLLGFALAPVTFGASMLVAAPAALLLGAGVSYIKEIEDLKRDRDRDIERFRKDPEYRKEVYDRMAYEGKEVHRDDPKIAQKQAEDLKKAKEEAAKAKADFEKLKAKQTTGDPVFDAMLKREQQAVAQAQRLDRIWAPDAPGRPSPEVLRKFAREDIQLVQASPQHREAVRQFLQNPPQHGGAMESENPEWMNRLEPRQRDAFLTMREHVQELPPDRRQMFFASTFGGRGERHPIRTGATRAEHLEDERFGFGSSVRAVPPAVRS